MRTDVIHKMLFEVGCSGEDAARALQHAIHHYTWPRIDKATDNVLQKFGKDHHLVIDKIELELGEISLSELEEASFADTFQSKLEESLAAWSSKHRDDEEVKRHPAQTNWEIIETFLLYGDLPWWIEKKAGLSLRSVLGSVLHSSPGRVESFLAKQKDNVARNRLWTLLTSRDKERFASWFNAEQDKHSVIKNLVVLQEPFKQKMLHQKQDLRKLVQPVIKKLPEKILPRLEKKINAAITGTLSQTQITERIESLLGEAEIFDRSFAKAFVKAWHQQQRKRKALMQRLLQDSELFEFLELIMQHPAPFEEKSQRRSESLAAVWQRTAKTLTKQLRSFGQRKQMHYQYVLNYGVYSSPDKKLIKALLYTLPIESLQLLTTLAELKAETMQQLVAKDENVELTLTSEREIIVENAGACLVAAYLPALFKELGYVENNRFKTKAHAIRAIYLIQYLVHGKAKAPEYLLQLNKILCGWRLASPLPARKRWRKTELSEADDLLQSIIQNWSALKNTSIDGLRVNFLQRKGILTENEHYWTLKVEKKSVDVLLGSIGWSFTLVKLPWMKKSLQVEW